MCRMLTFVIAGVMLSTPFGLNDLLAETESRYQVPIKGDVNGDKVIDITDAVLVCRILAGMNGSSIRSDYMTSGVDIELNNRIGLPEAIYLFQIVSDIRAQEEVFTYVYDVGPGKPYSDPSTVPWESIQPSTLVRIHYRDTPYATKWVIGTTGTATSPVVVRGVPDSKGRLPVITGENAVTRQELNYWNENRSVIKIGGASIPSAFPSYIIIEYLDVKSAHPNYQFTNRSGTKETYNNNAAPIHIEKGSHITIRNCILHDGGNGFFAGSTASDVWLEGNYIYGNGVIGNGKYHNSYTECAGIVFQYNHFGPLRTGAPGNNVKDRSAGTVIRYNWIETGNRTIELVDSGSSDLINDPAYRTTYVYGNVLIKVSSDENSQVIYYGGDSGDTTRYRKGTLWFYNNTIISYRSGTTTVMGIASNDEHVECFNTVVYPTAGGSALAITGGYGIVSLHHNWLPSGWVNVHGTLTGTINSYQNTVGTSPGFTDFDNKDFSLKTDSSCINSGSSIPSELLPAHQLAYQYVKHAGRATRPDDGKPDIGAFEAK